MNPDPDVNPDPIQHLLTEHAVIRKVLDAMQRQVASLATGNGGLDNGFWQGAADFVAAFADGCHHRKEEDVLFPHLLGHSRSERVFPIVKIKHEHVEGRALRQALCDAAAGDDATKLEAAVQTYSRLLREHMDGEEKGVFELASGLDRATMARILAEFQRVEEETLGEGGYQRYLALADELADGLADELADGLADGLAQ